MSQPVRIHDAKYHRHALLFTPALILPGEASQQYEARARAMPLLTQLTDSLLYSEGALELVEALSGTSKRYTAQQAQQALQVALQNAAVCLQSTGRIDVLLMAHVPIHAGPAELPALAPVSRVQPWDVPLRVRDIDALAGEDWDLCMRRIAPFIDGCTCAAAIAEHSLIDLQLVCTALRNLLAYKMIVLVDIFAVDNVYAVQPDVALLQLEPWASEALHFCDARNVPHSAGSPMPDTPSSVYAGGVGAGRSRDSLSSPHPGTDSMHSPTSASATPATPDDGTILPALPPQLDMGVLLRGYAAFGCGERVSHVALGQVLPSLGVDMQSMVAWGVAHGVLRRLHWWLAVPHGQASPVDEPVGQVMSAGKQVLRGTSTRRETISRGDSGVFRIPSSPNVSIADIEMRASQGGCLCCAVAVSLRQPAVVILRTLEEAGRVIRLR